MDSRFHNDWWWVHVRRNGEVLSKGWAGSTTKQELRDLLPKYRGYAIKLVRGPVQTGGFLTPEQRTWSFHTMNEALSSMHDALLAARVDS